MRIPIGILRLMAILDPLRARIAWEAGGLFYRDGIAATGVAALSKTLGISKRTLYERFGTKDALVAEALEVRDEPLFEQLTAPALSAPDARSRLLAFFEGLEKQLTGPTFRGCPFVNAAAEIADRTHPAFDVGQRHKDRLESWLVAQATEAKAPDPQGLARQLLLLVDGAFAQALLRGTTCPAAEASTAARTLIDTALGTCLAG